MSDFRVNISQVPPKYMAALEQADVSEPGKKKAGPNGFIDTKTEKLEAAKNVSLVADQKFEGKKVSEAEAYLRAVVLGIDPAIKPNEIIKLNPGSAYNNNKIPGALLREDGSIIFNETVSVNWNTIDNIDPMTIPFGTKYIVVEVLVGQLPELAVEADGRGAPVNAGSSRYSGYAEASLGKHKFIIPGGFSAENISKLYLKFAPGEITEGSAIRLYFSK